MSLKITILLSLGRPVCDDCSCVALHPPQLLHPCHSLEAWTEIPATGAPVLLKFTLKKQPTLCWRIWGACTLRQMQATS